MRPRRLRLAAMIAIVVPLSGCGGQPASTPASTASTSTSGSSPSGAAPSTAAPSSTSPSPTPSNPPLARDLSGGTPVRLGGAGHWTMAAGRAFVATDERTVVAIDLATGATAWHASFALGEPWDAQPTLALSADQKTVVAVRTVDSEGSARLDLLSLDAASGAVVAEQLMADPQRVWGVDLPPRVLAADAETVVLSADPESGRQTTVVKVATGELVWQVDDEAVAATPDLVVTQGGGWTRAAGTRVWTATGPLGSLLAQAPGVIVAGNPTVAVWLDPSNGHELARTGRLAEAELACAPTGDAVVCLDAGVSGYSLSDGKRLWSSSHPATSVTAVLGWVYLGDGDGRCDVLDARTGKVLAADVELPPIRYSDRTGVLLAATDGYRWVPFVP